MISVLDGHYDEARVIPRRLAAVALAALATMLSGCFFEVPLDPSPQVDMDPKLLGTWRCVPFNAEPADEAATFVVSRVGGRVYSVSIEVKGDGAERYDIHASRLKGELLLNVRSVAPAKFPVKPWTFARYTFLLPDVVRVQLVNEDKVKPTADSSAALRQAMEAAADAGELFGDYCVCVRAKSAANVPSNKEMQLTSGGLGARFARALY